MGGLLLLVHSPLVGHATWDLVAAGLAERGYPVGVPDLTGTVAAGPPYCSRQAEVIANSASATPAILIGHSGAGPLLAAAGALLEQVRGYIFVDAGLPTPGQNWMKTPSMPRRSRRYEHHLRARRCGGRAERRSAIPVSRRASSSVRTSPSGSGRCASSANAAATSPSDNGADLGHDLPGHARCLSA